MLGVRPESATFLYRCGYSFAACLALLIFIGSLDALARSAKSLQSTARLDMSGQTDNAPPCLCSQSQTPKKHKIRKNETNRPCKCDGQENPGNPVRPVEPPPNPGTAPGQNEKQKSPDRWSEAVKVLAEGGLALVSLTFAAFTFLYSSLLAIKEDHDPRANELRDALRHSLYATALTILLSSALTFVAFWTMLSGGRVLTVLTIVLAIVLLLAIPAIAFYLVVDAVMEKTDDAAPQ
jgi:hypothetical protein